MKRHHFHCDSDTHMTSYTQTCRGLRVLRTAMMVLLTLIGSTEAVRGQTVPAVIEYYHLDALGSVREVTNQWGTVVRRYDFAPFGEMDSPCTQSADARLFTGHERDRETCLDYMGARYYRPTSGRFLTIDPALDQQTALLDPQRWNRYAYTKNNPLIFVDPDGRQIAMASPQFQMDINRAARDSVSSWLGDGLVAGVADWLISPFLPATPQETAASLMGVATSVLTTPTSFLAEELAGAASRATSLVGPGRGPAYGTRVHTAFQNEVLALGNPNLSTEVSYLHGFPVGRGTTGLVRVDVVHGSIANPLSVFDLKTGAARLTPARIQQIQSHLPGGTNVPVLRVP